MKLVLRHNLPFTTASLSYRISFPEGASPA